MTIPIDKDRDQVREEYLDEAAQLQEEGLLPAQVNLNRGLIRSLLELFADGHTRLYEYLRNLLPQAFGHTATGDWLRMLHAPAVGITPITKTKASGYITFTRTETTGNVNIPASRIVKTKPDGTGQVYRFVTKIATVIPDGSTSVDVLAEAEEYGSASNVAAGMITEIVTYIPGVDGVTNASGWLVTEGVDDETDESLQNRYILAWKSINGATKAAYESWVRSISGVADVFILDQHPRGQGTVDVVVGGTGGAPTQNLLDAVAAIIEENRPINDDVEVYGVTMVQVDVEAELELTGGVASVIEDAAETALRTLFDVNDGLAIGEDATRDRIVAAIMSSSRYIKRVTLTTPSEDVEISSYERAELGTITIASVTAE
jgi:phage-related baseplate assembly protein